MIGFNFSVLLLATASLLSFSTTEAKRPHFPSPTVLLRDQADHDLDAHIKKLLRQDDGPSLIEPLDGNRVKMLNDTLISDYVQVNYYEWQEADDDPKDAEDDDYWNYQYGAPEKLYYIMAESRSSPETDPLIIWLQGGPGCSSMLGLYTENGPFNFKYNADKIKDPFELEHNAYAWNNEANVMYVDQPLGTGFSFINEIASLRWTEDQIADDFYLFLHNFVQQNPEFKGRDIYITGESYAGHYIPNIARKIQLAQDQDINLAGIAIGNGWVDPFYQYPAYPQFAASHNLISYGHSMVLRYGYSVCQFALILRVPFVTSTFCTMIGMTVVSPGLPDFNVYDIRLPCERMGLCYPDDHLWQLLNTYEYREVMNIPATEGTLWEECASLPHMALLFDFGSSFGFKLAPVLDAGLPVLIYNGDQDYICNWIGGYAWTNALVWDGQQEFVRQYMRDWQAPTLGATGGQVKSFENFTFLKVNEAGHMVPTDQPEAAYDMITEFMKTKTISSGVPEMHLDELEQ